MTTKQTQYEKLALLFVLNTGEIRKTCELDYNAYFGLLQINIDALKNLYGEWEDESESRIFPVKVASALYANALNIGF